MKPNNGDFWHNIKRKISLEAVFNSFPFGIYIKELSGSFLYYNAQIAPDTGIPSSNKKPLTDYDMPWKLHADLIIKQDQELIKQNNAVEINIGEYCLRRTLLHDDNQSPIAI